METKHLRLIKTLAERGGITRSLDRLFLTQSAVSHQLKDLEQRLGTKIFIRGKNHRGKDQWKLTDEGEVLYQTAVRVLDEIDNAMNAIQELRHGHQGTIRLSTECYTIYHWLPAFMQKMSMLYPKLEIIINMEATHRPLPKLLDNELDVALTSDPIDEKRLKYFELFRDEIFAVVGATHPWAKKRFVLAEDFAHEKLIIHSLPLESVTVYEHFLKPAAIAPQQIVPVPLTEATLELVKAEMGVTCMPMWALRPFVSSNNLRSVRIGKTGLTRTHFAAIRTSDSSKKHLADFIENLREEFL
ncbi:MAG TPA: LysR substrate-binding domain-containing protein [Pyrinomonadaceae bacterium]|nr:LysR substrate-binding domain-containing protein [Pyrinomonadaceae bacterium]